MSNSDSPAGSTGGPVTVSGLDDLPEKLRVHALAKLLGRTSREVMAALPELGFAARSVQSSVDRKTAEQVVVALVPEFGGNARVRPVRSPCGATGGAGDPARRVPTRRVPGRRVPDCRSAAVRGGRDVRSGRRARRRRTGAAVRATRARLPAAGASQPSRRGRARCGRGCRRGADPAHPPSRCARGRRGRGRRGRAGPPHPPPWPGRARSRGGHRLRAGRRRAGRARRDRGRRRRPTTAPTTSPATVPPVASAVGAVVAAVVGAAVRATTPSRTPPPTTTSPTRPTRTTRPTANRTRRRKRPTRPTTPRTTRRARPAVVGAAVVVAGRATTPEPTTKPIRRTPWSRCARRASGPTTPRATACRASVARPVWRPSASAVATAATPVGAACRSSARRSSWPAASPSSGRWWSASAATGSRSACSKTACSSSTSSPAGERLGVGPELAGRQHLPRSRAERAAQHGGRVRRHRARPQRRALRRRGRLGRRRPRRPGPPHRAGAVQRRQRARAGHEGPGRAQGRPADHADQPGRPVPGLRPVRRRRAGSAASCRTSSASASRTCCARSSRARRA